MKATSNLASLKAASARPLPGMHGLKKLLLANGMTKNQVVACAGMFEWTGDISPSPFGAVGLTALHLFPLHGRTCLSL